MKKLRDYEKEYTKLIRASERNYVPKFAAWVLAHWEEEHGGINPADPRYIDLIEAEDDELQEVLLEGFEIIFSGIMQKGGVKA